MKKEFLMAFEITRNIVFEVSYYTLGSNKDSHFSTSAEVLNRPKSDYNRCGQCQNDVLQNHKWAYDFFKKWDALHLEDLSEKQYKELISDVTTLKEKYNYIEKFLDSNDKPYSPNISFCDIVDLSKRKLK